MAHDIDKYAPQTGRYINESGETVNIADELDDHHNELIDSGTVSFELNQTTAETVDIDPDGRDDKVALVVYNPGAADISVEVSVLKTRGETLTAHQLVSADDLSVPAGTGRVFLINGFGVGEGTRLSFTPASGVAAFDLSYEVYRR